jgi:hypothetical protein
VKEFHKSLVGYKAKAVVEWIDYVNLKHQKKVKTLSADVGRLKAERDNLDSRMAALTKALGEAATVSPHTEVVSRRLERAAQAIIDKAGARKQEDLDQAVTRANMHRSQAMALDGEFRTLREKLDGFVMSVKYKVGEEQTHPQNHPEAAAARDKVVYMKSPGDLLAIKRNGIVVDDRFDEYLSSAGTGIQAAGPARPEEEKIQNRPWAPAEADRAVDVASEPVATVEYKPGDKPEEGRQAAISKENLNQAVEKHRISYLVGKLAGKDLYDENGEEILKDGDLITPEAVTRADAAGKLAELIVNMRIPGLLLDEAL